MKTLLIMVCLVAMVCGCSDSKKVAALEKRVSELERKQLVVLEGLDNMQVSQSNETAKLVVKTTELFQNYARSQKADSDRNLETMLDAIKSDVATEVKRSLDALRAQAGQRVASAPAARPAQPNQGQTRQGIPLDVYNQIAADVAKEWPGNFSMQKILIDGQVEDYKKLHSR